MSDELAFLGRMAVRSAQERTTYMTLGYIIAMRERATELATGVRHDSVRRLLEQAQDEYVAAESTLYAVLLATADPRVYVDIDRVRVACDEAWDKANGHAGRGNDAYDAAVAEMRRLLGEGGEA